MQRQQTAPRPEPGKHSGSSESDAQESEIKSGIVKWFREEKGFGFVEGRDGVQAFLHASALQRSNSPIPDDGQPCEFKTVPATKGPKVTWIELRD